MALQIKGKFISNEAVDGSKLKLKQGEAIRATWCPVPPVLLQRYNDLKRRFRETSRMALAM